MRIDTVETAVFEFSELSEDAQQLAVDNARELACTDSWWCESVIDDAKRLAAMIGIEIENIYFSGFSSQGDGAQFTGTYSYASGGTAELIAEAPLDTELHLISRALQDIQRRNFYQLSASVASRGHYSHSGCTAITVYDDRHNYGDTNAETDETVSQCLRDFMDWIYTRLENEYTYQTSETVAWDWLQDSGQEFTIDGSIH